MNQFSIGQVMALTLCTFFLIRCGGGGGGDEVVVTPVTTTFGVSAKFVVPQWTGPFNVGSREFHWIDESREEPHTGNRADRRELMVRLFYPTLAQSDENRLPLINPLRWALLEEDVPKAGYKLRRSNYQDVFWHVALDVPLMAQGGKLPVIIFSHGYGLTPTDHVTITAELASRGYIVASITHTYGSNFAEFPDGRVIGAMRLPPDDLGADLLLWSEDQSFVLSQLLGQLNEQADSDFLNRIDTQKIATMGHSYGGAAAYYTAWNDPRIAAAIDLDGTIFDAEGKDIEKPFMFIQNDNGYGWEIFDQVVPTGYAIAFENRIRHISFADYVLFWAWDFPEERLFGSLESKRAFTIIQEFSDQFLKQSFSGEAQPWFSQSDQRPSEVRFEIFD